MPTLVADHRRAQPVQWSKNTDPLASKALNTSDVQKFAELGTNLTPALQAVEELRKANSELRQKLWELSSAPKPGFMATCARTLASLFGASKPGTEALKRIIQGQISENLKGLKGLFDYSIQPAIRDIREQFKGKTFVKTKDTPPALLLASIPTEKVGKLPTHSELMVRVENYVERIKGCRARVTENTIGQRMVITRINKENERETLEISYRREGKVDVTVTGKSGVTETSLWNDDAEVLAKAFAAGKNFRFESRRYKHYTVA